MFRLVDNNFLNILLWFLIVIIGIIIIFYLVDWFLKLKPYLLKAKNFFLKNVFLLLLPFPFFYLVYYHGYYTYSTDPNRGLFLQKETADFLQKVSLYFFTGGVATATLKWLNNMIFFKKQFNELVRSKDFSEVLNEKMKILALSDEYLIQRSDLQDIWVRVTICKYKQKFPELEDEIKLKMENDFFLENSLSYYYKNFRLQVNFSLEGDIIKINEITSFTLISHNKDKIELNFGTSSIVEDNEEVYTKFIPENCKLDGNKLELEDLDVISPVGHIPDPKIKTFRAELEGKSKYIIERHVEITQNINDDRVFSFSSTRIIEDLSINLKHDSKLKLFFSPVGKNIFHKDNHISDEHSVTYISRDLLLPGEKFKVFIYKKG